MQIVEMLWPAAHLGISNRYEPGVASRHRAEGGLGRVPINLATWPFSDLDGLLSEAMSKWACRGLQTRSSAGGEGG